MKKILALLLALCMVFAFAACGSEPAAESDAPSESTDPAAESEAPATGDNVISIGVFEPLTGASGAGGRQEYLGMQYAQSLRPTVTIDGVEYTIEFVEGDNASSADEAPSAATSLISAGVSLVLGTYGSSAAIAAAPYFDDAQIPAIGVTCTNPRVTEGNEYYFRTCFIDPFQGSVLAAYAYNELGARHVYCLGETGNDYDAGVINYFQQAFEELGGTVTVGNFPENNSDFTSYINTAVSESADAMLTPVSIQYSTQIIAQAASLNLEMPILGSDTVDSNAVLEAIQGTSLSLYVTTFYNEGGDPDFDAGFKEFINSNSTNLENNGGNDTIAAGSVMGFDAYNVALDAIERAQSTSPADIYEALKETNSDGVTGNIQFDENGDAMRDLAYIKIADTENNTWINGGSQTVE